MIDLDDPNALAIAASQALAAAGAPHALYGGLALAAYGEARETRDADLAVLDAGAADLAATLQRSGLETATAFQSVPFGGLRVSRVTVLGGLEARGLNTVDAVVPASSRYARAVLDRAITAPLRGSAIPIVSPEDFVLLKALSSRDRDLDDAASVLRALGDRIDSQLLATEAALLTAEIPAWPTAARLADIHERSRR
jgi:hypothetical protein